MIEQITKEANMKMTYKLAHAAGMDAANARMRKAGRTKWNRADYNHCWAVFNRLFPVEMELAMQDAQ
jgi:hypothetical protein